MFVALCLMLETGTPYKKWLDEEDRRRRDRQIPRCVLRTFFYSSFYHLYQSRNDQALLNATGHDFNSFDSLLTLFLPYTTFGLMLTSLRSSERKYWIRMDGLKGSLATCQLVDA